MSESAYARAPAWRRTGVNLVDMAVMGGLWSLARSRGLVRERGLLPRLLAAASPILREQLPSPGQLLLGTRTVDRHTGRRLALWRTLALIAVGSAGQELTRRLEPARTPELEFERQAAQAEVAEIMRRHPQATPQREAELKAAYARHSHTTPSLARAVAPTLVIGVLRTRLRRRLAPTVEVLARGRE